MINKYLPLIARVAILLLIACTVLTLLLTGAGYLAYFGAINTFSGTPYLTLIGVFMLLLAIGLAISAVICAVGSLYLMTECEDFRTTIKNYVTKGEL